MGRAALAGLLLLVGCSSPTLSSHKADMSSWKRDDYECQRDSQQSYGASGALLWLARSEAEKKARQMYTRCMEARGYKVVEQ